MARPVKDGLEYFPFDVDFATNEKTEAIAGEFGAKGVLVFIYLLGAVYHKGYFLRWTELTKNQIANRVDGATGELVGLVIKRLVAYGVFDESLFQSDNVLTSQRIQETYFEATKRRKSQKPTLYVVNVDNNSLSSDINVDINTQSKVNESKQNETKSNTTLLSLYIQDARALSRPEVDQVVAYLQPLFDRYEKIGRLTKSVKANIATYVNLTDPNVVAHALNNTADAGKEWNYTKGILDNWISDGVHTWDDWARIEFKTELGVAE